MKDKHRWIRLIVFEHVSLRSCKDQGLPIASHSHSENMRLTLPPPSPEQIQILDVSSVCSVLVNHRESSCTVSLMTDINNALARKKNLSLLRIALQALHFKIISRLSSMLNTSMASFFIYQLRLILVKFFFQDYANDYWLKSCIGTSVFICFRLFSKLPHICL